MATLAKNRLNPILNLAGRAGSQKRMEALAGHMFAVPTYFLLTLVIIAPLLTMVWLSFTDYTLGAVDVQFVGLRNFAKMLSDDAYWRSVRNTALYVATVVPGSVGLGLAVALLVHRRTRSRRFYEFVYFLPVTSTLVAMAIVWQFLLHSRVGPVNTALMQFGIERIDFFTNPHVALYALAVIGIWQLIGFNMILFLAGLTAIPRELYEAAALDGADSGWDRFVRITWPMLGPTTMFVIITTSITAFQVFDSVAVLTRGGPGGATDVLLYEIYLEGFQYFDMGYAAAMTVTFLAFILTFSLIQVRVFEKRVHYG